MNDDEIVQGLRRWANGSPSGQGAVTILTKACGGRLVDALQSCIDVIDAEYGLCLPIWEDMVEASRGMSGGERRLIALAVSLGSNHPVVLQDVCSSLDQFNAAVVVEAIAEAVGHRFAVEVEF